MSTFAPSTKLTLLLSLLLGGAGVAMAQQTASADSAQASERKRPAPVTGRVEMDPAAVALRPVTAVKPAATGAVSQARQVPPPASHDDLLPPDTADVPVAETRSVKSASAGTPAVNAHHRHVQPQASKLAASTKAISKGKKKAHAGQGKVALSGKAQHKKDQPVRAQGGASKHAAQAATKPAPHVGHAATAAKKTKLNKAQPTKASKTSSKTSKATKAGARPHGKRASGAA